MEDPGLGQGVEAGAGVVVDVGAVPGDGPGLTALRRRLGLGHGDSERHGDRDADEDGVLAEWEREMRLMQQRPPLPREDELAEEETAQQVAVDVHADTLALLALDDAPDRHLHHTRRAERAIIRDLLLAPSGAARALGRAEEVWAPGEFDEEEGGSEPAAKGEDDDWDEEGMRWDEAEL